VCISNHRCNPRGTRRGSWALERRLRFRRYGQFFQSGANACLHSTEFALVAGLSRRTATSGVFESRYQIQKGPASFLGQQIFRAFDFLTSTIEVSLRSRFLGGLPNKSLDVLAARLGCDVPVKNVTDVPLQKPKRLGMMSSCTKPSSNISRKSVAKAVL
jgi:hypothetical protein